MDTKPIENKAETVPENKEAQEFEAQKAKGIASLEKLRRVIDKGIEDTRNAKNDVELVAVALVMSNQLNKLNAEVE